MKIAWTSSLSSTSGATPQALVILKGLQKRGHEAVLLNVPPLAVNHDAPFFESEFSGIRTVYPTRSVAEAVEALDPDVFVAHTLHPSILSDLPRIRNHYPVLAKADINLMELMLLQGYETVTPDIINFLRGVDHLTCESENTMNQMAGLGIPRSKMTRIPTVVDPSDFKPSTCRDPTILIMGRISPVKNHLIMLEAFKLVKEEIPEAELAIAGRGGSPRKETLERMIAQLRLEDCELVGYIGDLNYLFNEVSILAHPSITENMPQAVLEAYATGTPCVISDCGWSREFEAPLKAPHDDPAAISRQIIRLLSDEALWNEVREAQFKELDEKFNIEDALDKYEEVLESTPSEWWEWRERLQSKAPEREIKYRALFVVDVHDWAWDIASRELLQNLPEVQGNVITPRERTELAYDAVFVYPWADWKLMNGLDPKNTIVCVAGGEQLGNRAMFEDYCGRFKFYGACNREIQETLKRRYPDKEVLLLSHGVDTNLFKPSPHEGFTVGWVGNVARKSKRFKLAREIASEAGLELKVAGFEGDLAVKPGRIRVGKYAHERMPAFYNSNGCLLVTSEYEAHPLVVYEAMSCGLPVVTTKVGDVSEYITHGENGFLLDVDAPASEFAEILTMLKEDPALRERIGKAARNTILRTLKWGNIADQYRAALKLVKGWGR